jgi:hypothetical protein
MNERMALRTCLSTSGVLALTTGQANMGWEEKLKLTETKLEERAVSDVFTTLGNGTFFMAMSTVSNGNGGTVSRSFFCPDPAAVVVEQLLLQWIRALGFAWGCALRPSAAARRTLPGSICAVVEGSWHRGQISLLRLRLRRFLHCTH